MQAKLAKLEKILKVKFKNKDLLHQAMVHRSYLNENPSFSLSHNERLEFLGDAVLELVITDYLYNNYSNPEGELTNFRAALVNSDMLAKIANQLGLEEFLLMSKGESKDTGRARQYIMANAVESLIGAIYLDRGYKISKKFIEENIVRELPNILEQKLYQDPKSKFQEESQEREGITPSYEVIKDWGPDHDKHFIVGVFLGKDLIAKGEGKSKQDAQRNAAEEGLKAKGWK
ncbi:ribonuclease III [Patescibacteria group bacterium]|nr:ribonuclease III [Patescibacteria group bacterium]MBU4338165.1 ribonuclease III [Patescibacteria group bacterium]MBU4580731.1 ribonuclease III [Patescibacteria group bacterium]